MDDLDADELGTFDVIIAKSLLHHIDEDEILHLFDVAAKTLRPGGRFVTLDAAYTPDMSKASRFVVSRDRGQSILTPEGYERLARTSFGRSTWPSTTTCSGSPTHTSSSARRIRCAPRREASYERRTGWRVR